MRALILARHGESEYSVRGLCNGDPSVPVGLTERGREEAARLGRELAATEIDLCVTSEFPRARETAEIALEGRDVPHISLPELNDICYGSLEGETRKRYHAWQREHGRDARLPGGENRVDVADRAAAALRLMLQRDEPSILAVTHELVIELILNAAEGRDIAAGRRVEYATPHRVREDVLPGVAAALAAWRGPG